MQGAQSSSREPQQLPAPRSFAPGALPSVHFGDAVCKGSSASSIPRACFAASTYCLVNCHEICSFPLLLSGPGTGIVFAVRVPDAKTAAVMRFYFSGKMTCHVTKDVTHRQMTMGHHERPGSQFPKGR